LIQFPIKLRDTPTQNQLSKGACKAKKQPVAMLRFYLQSVLQNMINLKETICNKKALAKIFQLISYFPHPTKKSAGASAIGCIGWLSAFSALPFLMPSQWKNHFNSITVNIVRIIGGTADNIINCGNFIFRCFNKFIPRITEIRNDTKHSKYVFSSRPRTPS
jgi:hypothetical protein